MAKPYSAPIFYISLFCAFLFFFYPLRGDLSYWRPLFVFLAVVFWLLAEPHAIGVGFAWIVGLMLDLLTGGPLGQHALAMGICAYILQLAGRRVKNFSVWHQVLIVALLALVYQMFSIVMWLIVGRNADNWQMLYPVLSTVVLWPFVATLLWKFYRSEE